MPNFPKNPTETFRLYSCPKYYYTIVQLNEPLAIKWYPKLKAGNLLSREDWRDFLPVDPDYKHFMTYPLAYGLCQLAFCKRKSKREKNNFRINTPNLISPRPAN